MNVSREALAKQGLPVAAIVMATTSIVALCVFVLAREVNQGDEISQVNQDGISCIAELIIEHRLNIEEGPPRSAPRELAAACDRFLQAPR